jgi:putative transposase
MMCDFYGVSRSGFYAWCSRGPGHRQQANAKLVEVIKVAHEQSMGTYGSPRITEVLQQQGYNASENRIARLMQANQIVARSATLYHANPGTHAFFNEIPNRIRNLEVTGPDQIWVGDSPICVSTTNGATLRWSWTCTAAASLAGRWAGTAR